MYDDQRFVPHLREPAQYGKEAVRSLAMRGLVGIGALLIGALGTAAVAGWQSWAFVIVELGVLTALLVGDRWFSPQLDRRIQGNDGEVKVAEVLASAEPDGWKALHDVQTGRGNIDHVLVGPGGILTVETKSHRGGINVAALNPRWLRQAYAQKKLIERITGLKADALLVFSDAYLVGKPVSRKRGVCVLPARMLIGHLARRRSQLRPEEVDAIYQRLAYALSRPDPAPVPQPPPRPARSSRTAGARARRSSGGSC